MYRVGVWLLGEWLMFLLTTLCAKYVRHNCTNTIWWQSWLRIYSICKRRGHQLRFQVLRTTATKNARQQWMRGHAKSDHDRDRPRPALLHYYTSKISKNLKVWDCINLHSFVDFYLYIIIRCLIFIFCHCSLHIGGALGRVGWGYCKAQWQQDPIPKALLSARDRFLEGHNGKQNADDATAAPPYLGGNGQVGGKSTGFNGGKKECDVPRIASHEDRFKGPGKN